MRVWLVTVGEPLPKLSGGSRPWRTGMLAELLSARGHEVVWWTSAVDHFRKEAISNDSGEFAIDANLTLRFLRGCLYRRNVSLARLINHWQIGRHFAAACRGIQAPDVILCSFPTIELSREAVRFGAGMRVPVILDVRDLWPDIFLSALPPAFRQLARIPLQRYVYSTREAFAAADGIIAVSQSYLDWGLSYASRQAGKNDRVFPLAYKLSLSDLPPKAAAFAALEKHGVASGSITCVFAGTLGRTYDLEPVIETAAKLAKESASAFQFLICGDGERAEEWHARAAGVPNIAFTGWLDQRNMRAALAVADIGLAAYAEGAPQGIPNKIVEYLAAGLPVVSSLAGESEELLERQDCGRTYAARAPDSLYSALVALKDQGYRRRLARNARRTFELRFRAESVYGQLADLLEGVAGRGM